MARLKIGEVARRSGLTVRTLRHYEAIGLMPRPARNEGRQRLYGLADLERLQRIVALRGLGISLDEVRELLARPEATPLALLELQLARVEERIADLTRLRARLGSVTDALRFGETATVEGVLATLEMMMRVEKHYSSEQLDWLAKRRDEVGEERIKQVEAEWPRLIDEVIAAIDAGVSADDPLAKELAARWRGLVAEFTGGNPGIERAVQQVWEQDGEQIAQQHGMNPRMFECMAFIEGVGR